MGHSDRDFKKTENNNKQSAEFPSDEEIMALANYNVADPTVLTNPDPSKRYFFAAMDGDKTRPDGVERLESMGYKKSETEHSHPDCCLMEIRRDIYERRIYLERERREGQQNAIMDPPPGLEVVGDDHKMHRKKG